MSDARRGGTAIVRGRVARNGVRCAALLRRHARLLRVATTVAALVLLSRTVDLGRAAGTVAAARPQWLAAALALTALGIAGGAAQCGLLVRGGRPVRWRAFLAAYARSLFVAHVVPGGFGGDAILTLELGTGGRRGAVLGSLLASRLLGCTSMAAWGVAGAVLLAPSLGWLPAVAALATLLALAGSMAVATIVRKRCDGALGQLAGAIADSRRERRRALGALAMALAGWGANLAALDALAGSVGAGVPWTVFAVAVPVALTVTVLPVSVNGLGVREGVLVTLLLHAGASAGAATALAILVDVQPLPFALAGGLCFLGRRRPRPAIGGVRSAPAHEPAPGVGAQPPGVRMPPSGARTQAAASPAA